MSFKNFDVSLNSMTLNMEISCAALACLDSRWKHGDVLSPFTRVYFPIEGEGVLRTDDEEVRIEPGYIYVIPSMLKFSYSCESRLKKLFSHVYARLPSGLDAFSGIGKILKIKDCGECYFLLKYRELGEINGAFGLVAVISQALYRATDENGIQLREPDRYSQLTLDAVKYVNENLSLKLKIEDICESLYTSRQVLQKVFRREVGIPLGKYIDERVLIESERRLMAGESIDSISEALGFCDRFYFTRRFGEKYEKSPDKYRKISAAVKKY